VFFWVPIRKGMSFFSFSLLCRDNEQSQRSLKIFNPFLPIFGNFSVFFDFFKKSFFDR
jgi:hypothetical protein